MTGVTYAYAFVVFGLVLLVIGSEAVLRGGIGLSKSFGLSPLLIGLLVVSAGTSAPEMVVSLEGALHGAPDLVLGNVIGSNLVNILLILGIGAMMRPIPTSPKVVLRDGGVLVASSVALFAMVRAGTITTENGWMLLAGFGAYVLLSFFTDLRRVPAHCTGEARARAHDPERERGEPTLGMSAIILIFGLACLYFGGAYVVDGGVAVARLHHVPQAVVGLTLIAFGSSLPELVTTIVAAIRGHTSIAVGNLIGSNIFNILLVLGTTAVIHPLAVSPLVTGVDIYLLLGSAIALPVMLARRWGLGRAQGALLALSYLIYLGFLAWRLGYVPLG